MTKILTYTTVLTPRISALASGLSLLVLAVVAALHHALHLTTSLGLLAGIVALVLIAVGLLSWYLRDLTRYLRDQRLTKDFTAHLTPVPRGVVFGREQECSLGTVEVLVRTGTRYGVLTTVHYRSVTHLTTREVTVELLERYGVDKFTVVVDSSGDAYLSLPAVKVRVPTGEYLYLIFLGPELTHLRSREKVLHLTWGETCAEAVVRVEEKYLTGSLKLVSRGGVRGARLLLSGTCSHVRTEVPLCEVRSEGVEEYFQYWVSPPELTVVLTREEYLENVEKFLELLRLRKPVVAGLGEGRYEVKLVLDLPLRRDVFVSEVLY